MSEVKKKGTVKTELIIGTGVSKIASLVTGAKAIVAEFEKLPQLAEDYSLKIADAQSNLESLDVQFTEKKRQLMLDLEMTVKNEKVRLLDEYLKTDNLV